MQRVKGDLPKLGAYLLHRRVCSLKVFLGNPTRYVLQITFDFRREDITHQRVPPSASEIAWYLRSSSSKTTSGSRPGLLSARASCHKRRSSAMPFCWSCRL